MRRQMVECEDGRRRQARLYGETWMEEGHEDHEPESRECLSCQGTNPYDARFCCYCGNELHELSQEKKGNADQAEEIYSITQAAVRVKGKHVHGEAWFGCDTGIWYFLSSPEDKNHNLLPRSLERPEGAKRPLMRPSMVRAE